MIRESGRRDLRILDMCCGEGIIGLTIFSECQDQIKDLHFADINIFNLNSVQRTFALNGLAPLAQEGRLKTWLTDSLNNMPAQPFDIIVSNPPHIFRADFQSDKLNPGVLGTYDADWLFHRDFYAHCHRYLSENGEVWFLENKAGATPETFMGYIRENPDLVYARDFTEPREPGFFWMITKRKQLAAG
jgi:methylase of polypeptide subunit release factors